MLDIIQYTIILISSSSLHTQSKFPSRTLHIRNFIFGTSTNARSTLQRISIDTIMLGIVIQLVFHTCYDRCDKFLWKD